MSLVSLVIKSSSNPPASEYSWEKIGNIETFTKQIITPSIGEGEGSSNIGSVISGMPTVFARANMFRNAFDNVSDQKMSGNSLIEFYKQLIDEWKGLISCIALNQEKITVKRISLTYSDGEPTSSTINMYEPKGSFGNMLFERKPLWSDPNVPDSKPFIDVILYTKSDGKKVVIGGTSPDSLLFTSAAYNLTGENAPYIKEVKSDKGNLGVFADPLKLKKIDPQNLNKLYSYVKHIHNNLNKILNYYTQTNLVDLSYYSNISGGLDEWIKNIELYLKDNNIPAFENDEIPQINLFKAPFNLALNFSTNFYGIDGVISTDEINGVSFDPKELLLPKETKIACIDDGGNPNFLENKPLLLLKANVASEPNEFRFFTLPLTPKAIKVFGKSLGTILGLNSDSSVKSRLTAIYDPEATGENLTVTLNIFSETKKLAEIPVRYKTTLEDISNKDILIWPNFVSKNWNRYFIYSEMPHNSPRWQAIPFCADLNSENYDIISNENDNEFELIAQNGEMKVEYSSLKIAQTQQVKGSKYEYEIYESKNPFKGFQILLSNQLVGYVVIEYGSRPKDPIRIKSDHDQLEAAHLGFDFGSTNTAIAYRVGDGEAKGFQFKNRRTSLFSSDDYSFKNNDINPAGEDEVFYFQNDEIQSNEIKSVLAIHDKNRINNPKGERIEAISSEAVKGGFPCFEKNLPIEDSTESTYLLNFGDSDNSIGQATLIHSMKWNKSETTKEMDSSYRKAYLSSLLLQVYADMFDLGYKPETLRWSYPSAMGQTLISDYSHIWQSLKYVSPLTNESQLIISEKFGNIEQKNEAGWGVDNNGSSSETNSWGEKETSNNDGWGNTSENTWGSDTKPEPKVSNSWGEEEKNNQFKSTKDINYDDAPISFNFKKIDLSNKTSLTESEAVANYLINTKSTNISTEPNVLTICFDIGGSTSDIIALTSLDGQNMAMVKQSSIRFAAQRVAQATRYSKNFKQVIIDLLNKKNVKIEGLNKGENKYTQNTAPYYFEQVVDRLEENEFDDFYRELGTKCKEMVAVNLYVTGIIVFYAGQIAKKIKLELDRSPDKPQRWSSPEVILKFTGKGSRIMDWLAAINPGASQGYYFDLFIKGFGGIEEAKIHLGGKPEFVSRKDHNKDVKYEVAKGLAASAISKNLYVADNTSVPLELIGEEGFIIAKSDGSDIHLKSDDSITPEMIQNIGGKFLLQPQNVDIPCPRFAEFAQMYFQVATTHFDLKATKEDFIDGFKKMNISDYIRLSPEYKMAQKNEGFDFVAPIIIMEAMNFFEKVILKKISSE